MDGWMDLFFLVKHLNQINWEMIKAAEERLGWKEEN